MLRQGKKFLYNSLTLQHSTHRHNPFALALYNTILIEFIYLHLYIYVYVYIDLYIQYTSDVVWQFIMGLRCKCEVIPKASHVLYNLSVFYYIFLFSPHGGEVGYKIMPRGLYTKGERMYTVKSREFYPMAMAITSCVNKHRSFYTHTIRATFILLHSNLHIYVCIYIFFVRFFSIFALLYILCDYLPLH